MSVYKINFFVLLFALAFFQTAKSQQMLSESELENLLTKAERQSQNYGVVFQNLSAEETKTKHRFKPNGSVDEKRVIKSIFVVYQSPNSDSAQEFRNVVEFNGANVSRSDKETAAFFEKLARADTTKEELAKIRKESLRFDGNRVTWGMTLHQTRPFNEELRKIFSFRATGKERIEGRDAWIVEYEQTQPSPYIVSNQTDREEQSKPAAYYKYDIVISNVFRPTNPLMKGKIWLDAGTGQMRRNQFEVTLHPARLSKSIVAIKISTEYQSSQFGILVPKRFVITSHQVKAATTTI